MTVRLPAWLQSGAYTAEIDRSVPTGLLLPDSPTGARGGVRRWQGNEFQVLATVPATTQVTVKPGMAWVQGGYSSVQGAYVALNDADVNLTISAAHASLSRIDLIVLEILDSTYSGAANTAQLRVVTGTAAASPAIPSVTGSYIILARVTVGPGVTSIASSAIVDSRPYVGAIGGVMPVKDATERLNLTGLGGGTEVLELDTGRVYQYGYGTSGGWLYTYGGTPPLDWITPTLLNGWTLYAGTGTVWRGVRFRKTTSGQVEIQGFAQAGSFGAAVFRLPAGYRPSLKLIFVAATGEPNMSGRFDILTDGYVFHQSSEHGYAANASNWMCFSCTFTPDQ